MALSLHFKLFGLLGPAAVKVNAIGAFNTTPFRFTPEPQQHPRPAPNPQQHAQSPRSSVQVQQNLDGYVNVIPTQQMQTLNFNQLPAQPEPFLSARDSLRTATSINLHPQVFDQAYGYNVNKFGPGNNTTRLVVTEAKPSPQPGFPVKVFLKLAGPDPTGKSLKLRNFIIIVDLYPSDTPADLFQRILTKFSLAFDNYLQLRSSDFKTLPALSRSDLDAMMMSQAGYSFRFYPTLHDRKESMQAPDPSGKSGGVDHGALNITSWEGTASASFLHEQTQSVDLLGRSTVTVLEQIVWVRPQIAQQLHTKMKHLELLLSFTVDLPAQQRLFQIAEKNLEKCNETTTCPICMEETRTVTSTQFPCGHRCCKQCARLLAQHNSGREVPCPLCRHPTGLQSPRPRTRN